MHVRVAKLEDIPSIVSLGRSLLEAHVGYDFDYYQLEGNFDELFATWAKEQINASYQFLFVAEDEILEGNEGKTSPIIGFVSGFLKALYPWFKTKAVGHISFLIVNSSYRQKGIGTFLEDKAKEWFLSKNISYVEVYVEEKNSIGQIAWDKYGFLPFKKFLRKKIT